MCAIRLLLAPILFFVFASWLQPPVIYAQVPTGTEFLVPLPALVSIYERNDTTIQFRIEIFCSRRTKVSVRWPNTGTYMIRDAVVNAGERIYIAKPMFDINQLVQSDERYQTDSVNMRALWITTDRGVTVHATFDRPNRSETYTIMPVSSYDTTYRVVDYAGYSYGGERGGFLVTATEDNTEVYVVPAADVHTLEIAKILKGYPFTFTLQKNQIRQVLAGQLRQGFASDMSGSFIRSSKPVGVIAFSKGTNVPVTKLPDDPIPPAPPQFKEFAAAAKTIVNPNLPNNNAGTRFYTMPFGTISRVRFVATQAGTTFTMDGAPAKLNLGSAQGVSVFNAGEIFEINITAPTMFEASKPVVGAQFDTTAPMMATLYPVEDYKPSLQWVSPLLDSRIDTRVVPNRTYIWGHYVTVIAPVEADGSVTLDGKPIIFNKSFSDGKYVGAVIPVTPSPHEILSDYPVSAIAYGLCGRDSYGMNTGESVRAIGRPNVDTLRFTTCEAEHDTIIALANIGNDAFVIDTVNSTGIEVRVIAPIPVALPQIVAAGSQQLISIAIKLPNPGTYTGMLRIVTDANNRKIFEIPMIITRDSALLAAPTEIDFGVIRANETTHDTTIIIRNNGSKALVLTTADFGLSTAFTLLSPALPDTIAPGATDSLRIRITPGNAQRTGTLTLRGDPCLTGLKIDLRGFQGGGASLLVQRSIDYPSFTCTAPATVDSVLHIRSIGDEPVTINTWKINNDPNNEFSLLDDPVALSPILQGDTMHVRVRFSPKQPGLPRAASLDMTTTAVNAPTLSIALRGALDTVFLQSSLSEIRFAQLRSCDAGVDTTITLTNGSSTIPDTITALNLGDNVTYTVTPSLPIIVYPGSPQTLRIRFAPQSDKTFPDTLRIVGSGCNSGATIILSGERVAPALTASAATLRFDTLYACDQKPIKRKIGLTNTGTSLTDTIVSATMAGNTAFTVTPLAAPIILLPGQTDSVEVTFTPNGGGDYIGALVLDWGPCAQTTTVNVTGLVIEPTLEYSASDLDFGKVDIGTGSRKSIVVANTGRVARTITSLDLGGVAGLRIVSPTLPVTIEAGDTATFEIEYAPTDTATLSATAKVTVKEPCPSEQTVTIKGQGVAEEFIRASLTLAVPAVVTGVVDDTVDVRVSITQSTLLAEAKPSKLRFVLRHNYTMLSPIKTGITTSVGGATVQVLRDEIIGSQRELEIELSGNAFPAQGEVVRIPSLVLIGDAMKTQLELDTVSLTLQQANAIVSVKKESGEFQVQGVCVTGEGGRLIRLGGATLKSVRPNPFRGATAIDFEMLEGGGVEIVVLDMDGVEIAQVVNGELGAGSYSVPFDGSRLPSGLYFCELRSKGERMRCNLILIQ